MSEGASGASAGVGGGEGQSQGQQSQQTSQAASAQQSVAQGGGEGKAQTGAESVQQSFEKAGTQTISQENAETQEGDDYMPIKDYIRKTFADEAFDNDEQVDRRAFKHIKDLEDYRQRNTDTNERIVKVFAAHPELIGVIRDMDEGADFAEALALNIDPESRKLIREQYFSDEYKPEKETWATKKQEREKKFTERQQWTQSYAENRKISANNLKEFATENKLDQSKMEGLAKFADGVLADVYNGKVSKQFLAAMLKAMNADAEIAKAAEVAEVKGRNAAIGEKATKQEPVGDGLPELSKGGETKSPAKRTDGEQMVFSLVDKFKKNTERFS